MLKLKEKVNTLFEIIADFFRRKYQKRLQKELHNSKPSIISSNCIGGIMYHDLGLLFSSPTVNLFFKHDDYISFLENLEGFLSCSPKEIKLDGYNYPVGELTYKEITIKLFFMHYKTFEEAYAKWEERKKRIDFNNLFIVWEVALENGPEKDLLNRFLKLDYKNKVLITGKGCTANNPEIFKIDLYGKKHHRGKIL